MRGGGGTISDVEEGIRDERSWKIEEGRLGRRGTVAPFVHAN